MVADFKPSYLVEGLPGQHGPVALLSQSGASSSAMLDFATMVGVGMSYMVTLGNEAMITAGHVLDYLVDDEQTKAVAIFMETIRDPDTFRQAARRAAEAGKAIVVVSHVLPDAALVDRVVELAVPTRPGGGER